VTPPILTLAILKFRRADWWGGPEAEVAARAALLYLAALIAVRVAKKRLLGKATPFDMILAVMIGSLFSRAINGSAPIGPSLVAGVTLIFMHRLFSYGSFHWRWLERLIKGKHMPLVVQGRINQENLRKAEVTESDLHEELRVRGKLDDVRQVALSCLERYGKISVLPQPPNQPRVLEARVEEGVQVIRIELK
jgi:uncharacterized membrane protein YcaP (DUF421 family)